MVGEVKEAREVVGGGEEGGGTASRQRSQSSPAGRGPQGAWSRGSQDLSEGRGREKRLGGGGTQGFL